MSAHAEGTRDSRKHELSHDERLCEIEELARQLLKTSLFLEEDDTSFNLDALSKDAVTVFFGLQNDDSCIRDSEKEIGEPLATPYQQSSGACVGTHPKRLQGDVPGGLC